MFYISTLELTLTCALIAGIFILPVMAKRFIARMKKQPKNDDKKK